MAGSLEQLGNKLMELGDKLQGRLDLAVKARCSHCRRQMSFTVKLQDGKRVVTFPCPGCGQSNTLSFAIK